MVEMLATLAVMVILLSLAAGSFSATVSNNRMYSTQSELLSSLALAKTEATRRGAPVVVSAKAPVAGNEFGGGWVVWVDANNNDTLETGEAVLREHEALPASVVVTTGTNGGTAIKYGVLGFLSPAAPIGLNVCPSQPNPSQPTGYSLSISPNGMSDIVPSTAC